MQAVQVAAAPVAQTLDLLREAVFIAGKQGREIAFHPAQVRIAGTVQRRQQLRQLRRCFVTDFRLTAEDQFLPGHARAVGRTQHAGDDAMRLGGAGRYTGLVQQTGGVIMGGKIGGVFHG